MVAEAHIGKETAAHGYRLERSSWEILAQPFEPDLSKARLEKLFAPLKAELPALLEQAPLRPGPIRVEADELSYCLHIVLRFELELALLEQGMPVEELPKEWNQRMVELLGIKPQADSEGCLQDIHWAE